MSELKSYQRARQAHSAAFVVREGRPAKQSWTVGGVTYTATTGFAPGGQTKQMAYANAVTMTFSYDPEPRWLDRVNTTTEKIILNNPFRLC